VYESLKHRKTALEDATGLVATIISLLLQDQSAEIDRTTVIKTTHMVLKRFDTPAYTHYSAYHPLSK
jgi:transcriptional regulator NrdR family protein